MIKKLKSIPDIFLYALPLLFVFIVYLLAYWPGILVSDALYQWDQVQTFNLDNWHPVFNTLYIWLLTRIINSPTFVIFVQLVIFSFVFSYSLTKLQKYYKISRKFLFIIACIFALVPLNANFAVLLLKDILYSVFVMLLSVQFLCIINEENWLKNKLNFASFSLTLLIISLFRHNGIVVVILSLICLFFLYLKKTKRTVIFLSLIWVICYLFLNVAVTSWINVKENTYMNKYGPVAHLYAAMLNDPKVKFSDEELNKLSYYVDVDKLKSTYDPFFMDPSIGCQNIESLKLSANEFAKMGINKALKYPLVTIKHYLLLTSFLYSPLEFKGSKTAGMYVSTDLWVYKDKYSYLDTQSKFPLLLKIIKFAERAYQYKPFRAFTIRPALYIYLSIIMTAFLCFFLKTKKIILLICPSVFNVLSLAVAIPAHMTRYVYSSILIFWIIFIVFASELYKYRREQKLNLQSKQTVEVKK